MFLRSVIVWLLIALAETLHGILRVRLLNRRIGDRQARQVGVLTGSIMILLIGWLTMPWIGPASIPQCLTIGALWLALMLTFEFGLGHWVFRFSWRRLTADFDLCKGGLLSLGMAVLFLTPLITAKLRGLI
ncbi:MAG: hypothetical protein ACKO21_04695 [Nodosilinea sp.]